ncbi:exonuclease V [Abortiporus biennis]|nr:exonuclease V [Abortiporus biennis]
MTEEVDEYETSHIHFDVEDIPFITSLPPSPERPQAPTSRPPQAIVAYAPNNFIAIASSDEFPDDFADFTEEDFATIDQAVIEASAPSIPQAQPTCPSPTHIHQTPVVTSTKDTIDIVEVLEGFGGPAVAISLEVSAADTSSLHSKAQDESHIFPPPFPQPKLAPKPAHWSPFQRSPFQRFRQRNGTLSVTDLTGPAWCELQFDYGLRQKRSRKLESRPTSFVTAEGKTIDVNKKVAKVNDQITTKGRSVHKALELELHPEQVPVTPKTKEERWGLRVFNMIVAAESLITQGRCREMPVFGLINEQVVVGIIDEIERKPLPPVLQPLSIPSSDVSLKRSFPNTPTKVRPPSAKRSKTFPGVSQTRNDSQNEITNFFPVSSSSKSANFVDELKDEDEIMVEDRPQHGVNGHHNVMSAEAILLPTAATQPDDDADSASTSSATTIYYSQPVTTSPTSFVPTNPPISSDTQPPETPSISAVTTSSTSTAASFVSFPPSSTSTSFASFSSMPNTNASSAYISVPNSQASTSSQVPPHFRLHISDTKTRSRRSLPADEDTLSAHLQLMLYRQLLGDLLSGANRVRNEDGGLDWMKIWMGLGINDRAPFSKQFRDTLGLDDVYASMGGDSGDEGKVRCLEDLMRIWRNIVEMLNVDGVDDELVVVYRMRGGEQNDEQMKGKGKETAWKRKDHLAQEHRAQLDREDEDMRRAVEASLKDVGGGGYNMSSYTDGLEPQELGKLVNGSIGTMLGTELKPTSNTVFGQAWGGSVAGQNDPQLEWAIQQSLLDHPPQEPEDHEPTLPPPISTEPSTENILPIAEDTSCQPEASSSKLPPSETVDTDVEADEDDDQDVEVPPEIIGCKVFKMDKPMLDNYLQNVMEWWFGKRPPRGVGVELTRRCGHCEYKEGCEWREQKAEEEREKARQRNLARLRPETIDSQ